MNRAKMKPQIAYAQVASASVRYDQPSLIPDMGVPAGWSAFAIRLAFHTLQAYRIPRQRLTAVPANVTNQAWAGTFCGACMLPGLLGKNGSIASPTRDCKTGRAARRR